MINLETLATDADADVSFFAKESLRCYPAWVSGRLEKRKKKEYTPHPIQPASNAFFVSNPKKHTHNLYPNQTAGIGDRIFFFVENKILKLFVFFLVLKFQKKKQVFKVSEKKLKRLPIPATIY